jgi:phosphate-selective porin OprO/OprP
MSGGSEHTFQPILVAAILRLFVLVFFFAPSPLPAQANDAVQYDVPDIPDSWAEALRYKNEHFSVAFLFGTLLDYTTWDQDQQSVDQVGIQEDEFEVRSLRFLFAGTLDFMGPWSYVVALESNRFDQATDNPRFALMDAALIRRFVDGTGRLVIGKQKQAFVYEMVGDSANLLQHERFLGPFFVSRSWGVTYTHTYLEKRLGVQVGWYNDWFEEGGNFGGEGNQLALRLTGLPVWRNEGAQLLHIGISARYQEDENGTLQYRGRPGSNVADFYVDTGSFEADYSRQVGLEALWQSNKLTVLGEYARTWVTADAVGNPQFNGFYVAASYLFNGELRPYDTSVRYSRRVIPGGGWGALEPFVMFGRVDLDDAALSGGSMEKWYVGLNWWATRRWKMSIGYGDIELDRFDALGTTNQVLLRMQWIGP